MNENDEISRWKRVAAYLADCHAANVDEALLSRASKNQRWRYKSIMEKAAEMMKGGCLPGGAMIGTPDGQIQSAIERCERNAALITL